MKGTQGLTINKAVNNSGSAALKRVSRRKTQSMEICSPTHSIFLAHQLEQEKQKRGKSRTHKHLRKPPSFEAYLSSSNNSSSTSLSSSYKNSFPVTPADSYETRTSNYSSPIYISRSSHLHEKEQYSIGMERRATYSSVIRFKRHDYCEEDANGNEINYNDWDFLDDYESSEDEEDFFLMGTFGSTNYRKYHQSHH
ncbi:hypothetical protein G9A89_022204 [Geosiphon pyriformis]|nr:hypothetical protein G9A89_022204 [Geosiphon pyriformis]